jgi:hypothetical protein
MADETFPLTLPERLARRVSRRGLGTVVVPRDLERYYLLLAEARYRLRGRFSAAEINLICHLLTVGMLWEGLSSTTLVGTLAAALADPPPDGPAGARWADVDRPALAARFQALTAVEVTALVDALEQFWLDAWWTASDWAPGLALWDPDG